MQAGEVRVTPVAGKKALAEFVDLPFRLYANDPNWVPPLKDEVYGLLTPGKNPWLDHPEAQFFLARRAGQVVGRISAVGGAEGRPQPTGSSPTTKLMTTPADNRFTESAPNLTTARRTSSVPTIPCRSRSPIGFQLFAASSTVTHRRS